MDRSSNQNGGCGCLLAFLLLVALGGLEQGMSVRDSVLMSLLCLGLGYVLCWIMLPLFGPGRGRYELWEAAEGQQRKDRRYRGQGGRGQP